MMNKIIPVGALFFGILAASFYFTVILQTDTEKKFPYRLKLYYPQIDGIREGTMISINGLPKGIVKELNIIPSEFVPDKRFLTDGRSKAIELTIGLSEQITLWDNYEVKFKAETPFSGRSIDIDPGSSRTDDSTFFNPNYKDENHIPDFAPSAAYYDDFFVAANHLLLENRADLRVFISNTREITDKINNGNGTLPQLINNDIVYNALGETVLDANILGKEARRFYEGFREYNTIPIPFTINLYKRQTTLGRISDKAYFGQSAGNKTLVDKFNNLDGTTKAAVINSLK